MKKKRLILFFITLCVALMFLSGCGRTGVNTSNQSSAKVSGINEFPITDEEITLEIFTSKLASIGDITTNEFTKWYEEKTNVKINWNLINGDIRQAINLKIASDDYSDIFYNFSLARSEQVSYYNQGIFIDMTDLVDKHGYYIKKMFEDSPEIEKNIRHTDNKILGLPTAVLDFSAENGNVMWVYQPWMEKLGLDKPKTTDDFYNMLKAFKERDPNGNRIADEIPLAARNNRGGQIGLDNYIMNAFNFSNKNGFYNKNGVATFAPIEEDFKEGLKYIRKLYKEGLIHPDSFIMDRARVTALAENDIPILGAAPGKWTTQFTAAGSASGRTNEFVAIPPLTGPKGFRQTLHGNLDTGLSCFNITSQCKNPEAAIKWIDWFYSQEAYLKTRANEGTRLAKEGELGFDGEQAILAIDSIKDANLFDTTQNKRWLNLAVGYCPVETSIKTANFTDDRIRSQHAYEAYLMYKPYGTDAEIGDFPMSAEISDEYLELRSNITSAIDSGMVTFIIGEQSIEDDWDDYVQNFYSLGLERYTEIHQQYLDSIK